MLHYLPGSNLFLLEGNRGFKDYRLASETWSETMRLRSPSVHEQAIDDAYVLG